MGGLWRYMPITWITSVIGALALVGIPGFAGFYSKDSIIEAVGHSQLPGSGFAQFAVTAGVFVTALYTFRMIFLVFHGKERFGGHDEHWQAAHANEHEHAHAGAPPRESPAVVWVPLVLLAIPSAIAGAVGVQAMVAGDYFAGAIAVERNAHEAMAELSREFPGALDMALDGFTRLPFLLAAAGIAVAWLLYLQRPDLPAVVRARVPWLYRLLDHKYYLDQINEVVFAGGARWIGAGFWKQGDVALIDGVFVNGSARMVGRLAQLIRRVQSGFIYHYAFIMLVGVALMLFVFLTWPYLPALIADSR